jgi:hypothetical protein
VEVAIDFKRCFSNFRWLEPNSSQIDLIVFDVVLGLTLVTEILTQKQIAIATEIKINI